MGVQVFKSAKAPEQWVLAEREEEHDDNRRMLLGAGGDRHDEDIGLPEDEHPALDPYSVQFEHTMAFKCDETLRDWIDAVGFAHGFSRSEILRRLVFLGIRKLDGEIARVPAPLEEQAA